MAQQTEPFLIGVDGGGSRCRFAVADASGRVLARHEEGSANVATDFERASQRILDGLITVWMAAGLDAKDLPLAVAYVGVAGANARGAPDRVRKVLPFKRCEIGDDRFTSVVGALGDSDGTVVSVGTGSFVCRQMGGDFRSVGGWGFYIGDDASGGWLGKKLLRQAVLVEDGLAHATDLTRAALAECGGSIHGLVDFSLQASPRDYAAFAPTIVAAAKAGDPVGENLMRAGADYIEMALAALGHHAGDTVCFLGGLGQCYADWLPETLTRGRVAQRGPAVSGALILAARLAGIETEGKPWI